jgi:hypothetical protein
MPVIYSLPATLTQEAAVRMLAPPGVSGRLQSWQRGPLRAVASVYIPFRLYKITMQDRGAQVARYYAVDSASGLLDPYEFPGLPELAELETRNALPVVLPEARTRERAIEKLRRHLYSTGFFRLRNPAIGAELAGPEFYVPYWAGFFGREHDAKITVVDAVRHTIEGGKVRRLVQGWLMEQAGEKC